MSKWISDAYLDLIMDEIKKSDREVMCSAQPLTFFNAVYPDLWTINTAYVTGAVIRPPTMAGFVYECTSPGTSGGLEPGWTSTQDSTFTDGSVTWKAHANYSLASEVLAPADLVIANGDIDGRKLTIAQKLGVVTHSAGTVTHAALITTSSKTLQYVTTAQTTINGNNDVVAGRTTIFFTFDVVIRDPA